MTRTILLLTAILAASACASISRIGARTHIDNNLVRVWSDEQMRSFAGVIESESFIFYATSRSSSNACVLLSFTNSTNSARWDSGGILVRPGTNRRLIHTVERPGRQFGLVTDARAWTVSGTDCSTAPP
jgi:hypothetical protein